MARRRKRKVAIEKLFTRSTTISLIGLGLCIIAAFGLFEYGIVGRYIQLTALFLMGSWYYLFYIILFVSGLLMIFKGDNVYLLNVKVIGLALAVLMLLALSHYAFVDLNVTFKAAVQKLALIYTTNIEVDSVTGGGVLGLSVATCFMKWFDLKGAQILSWVMLVLGLGMFTGISIFDLIRTAASKTKQAISDSKILIKENGEEAIEDFNQKVPKKAKEEPVEAPKVIVNSSELEALSKPVPSKVYEEPTDTEPTNPNYHLPSIDLLTVSNNRKVNTANHEAVKTMVPIITRVFKNFGVEARVVKANIGPAVTQYEIEVKDGTRVSSILSLNRELALALAAKNVRIQAPIPGKSTVGIEIPNRTVSTVSLREVFEAIPPKYNKDKLLAVLGRDIEGSPEWVEINKTPHLLVAGATGSGKSVCINSIIVSLLMRARPDEVKLVLIDPKKVEFSIYNGIPHLLTPVVTDPHKANFALKKVVSIMEERYNLFEDTHTKNIESYNEYVVKENQHRPSDDKLKALPYIVVIIDELADLMVIARKEVEDSIMRITQMARAAGIHLIVATQRPSIDVITGVIKANIPSRISFAVSSNVDSRTILDMAGAEKLLGRGDMLFLMQGENTPIRIQGTFVSDEEINNVVKFVCHEQMAHYDQTFTLSDEEKHATSMVGNDPGSVDDYEEPLYGEIVKFVVSQGKASASLLQRRFRLGYNRAARCMDLLEERGIVGPQDGSKARQVLVAVNADSDKPTDE